MLNVEVLQVHELATIAPRQFFAVLNLVLGNDWTSVTAANEYRFFNICHENQHLLVERAFRPASRHISEIPSGAKARCIATPCGTAEAVPFQNRFI